MLLGSGCQVPICWRRPLGEGRIGHYRHGSLAVFDPVSGVVAVGEVVFVAVAMRFECYGDVLP